MVMVQSLPLPLSLAPSSGSAWDAALLGEVAETNEQLLECLRSLAAEADAPRLLQSTQAHWQRLDASSMRRLASCPYLLLDLRLAQSAVWQRPAADSVMDQPQPDAYFRTPSGVALLRRTLVLAWHVARSNRLMATLAFGMSSAVGDCLGSRGLCELEALAERLPVWITPRWERQPVVWRQMIEAACSADALALRAVTLRGWQLLARERHPIC
jgi:hypothetical protein